MITSAYGTASVGSGYVQGGQGFTNKMNVNEVVNEINDHIRAQAARRHSKGKGSTVSLEPLIINSINSEFQRDTLFLFDENDSTAFDTGLNCPSEQYIKSLYWGTLGRFFNQKATKAELDKAMTNLRGVDQINALMATVDTVQPQGIDPERLKACGGAGASSAQAAITEASDVAMKRDKRSSSSSSSSTSGSSSKKSSKTSKRKASEAATAVAAAAPAAAAVAVGYEPILKPAPPPPLTKSQIAKMQATKQKREDMKEIMKLSASKQAAAKHFTKCNITYSLAGFETPQITDAKLKRLSINVSKMLRDSQISTGITYDFVNLLKIAMNIRLKNILMLANTKRLAPSSQMAQTPIPSTPYRHFPQFGTSLYYQPPPPPPPPPPYTYYQQQQQQQQQQQRFSSQQKPYQRQPKSRLLIGKNFLQAMGPPIDYCYPHGCITEDSLRTVLETNPHLAIPGTYLNQI